MILSEVLRIGNCITDILINFVVTGYQAAGDS